MKPTELITSAQATEMVGESKPFRKETFVKALSKSIREACHANRNTLRIDGDVDYRELIIPVLIKANYKITYGENPHTSSYIKIEWPRP